MKTLLYKIKITSQIILLMILLCISVYYTFLYEYNDISQEILPSLSQEEVEKACKAYLYEILITLIKKENFILLYGQNQTNPIFLHYYYVEILCKPVFISDFLDTISIQTLLVESSSEREFIIKVMELFFNYIDISQQAFQRKINSFISAILFLIAIRFVRTNNLIHDELLDLLDADIISPEIMRQCLSLEQKIFAKGLIVIILWIASSLLW